MTEWRKALFGREWYGEPVEAFVCGSARNGNHGWNGFAQPVMQGHQVLNWMRLQEEKKDSEVFAYFEEDVLVIQVDGADDYRSMPARVRIPGDDGDDDYMSLVWDVGAGLCWIEEETEG